MLKPAGPALLVLNFEARLEGRVPLEAYTLPVVQRPDFGEPVPVRSLLSAIRKIGKINRDTKRTPSQRGSRCEHRRDPRSNNHQVNPHHRACPPRARW